MIQCHLICSTYFPSKNTFCSCAHYARGNRAILCPLFPRSERVCDKDSIKREWLFIICVTFSLSNSPDIRVLCLKIWYLCFWFVFKILFSSIHCVLYFYFVPHCSTISMFYLYVHLCKCITMYTRGHIAQCIKK